MSVRKAFDGLDHCRSILAIHSLRWKFAWICTASLAIGLPLIILGQLRIPKVPVQISNEVIAKMLAKTLNDGLPLKLDGSSALPLAALDDGSFKPRQLTLTAENLERRLPPGDYAIPVTMYCTKDSLHVAGRGVGYALAYMQGRAADALSMLYLRGALKGTPWPTLQAISWSVQASVPYGQMPPQFQQVINDLIPEYRSRLSGDFLQSFEAQYNLLAKQFGPRRLPRFDQILSHTGSFGVNVAQLRRSREIIRRNALNFDRLEQQLVNTTLTADEKSSWAQVRPGVYARLKVVQGYHGLNWLEVRMVRTSGAPVVASPLETLYGIPTVSSKLRSALRSPGDRIEQPSVVRVAFQPDPSPGPGGGLIGYPIQKPTQTHAIAPLLVGGGGPPPPEPPCVDPKEEDMPCKSHPIYAQDAKYKHQYEDPQVRVETGMMWTNAVAPADCAPGGGGTTAPTVLHDGITITVKNCQNPRVVQFIHREQVLANGTLESGTYGKSTGCASPPIQLSLTNDITKPAWHADGTPYYNGYRKDCDPTKPDSMTIFDAPNFKQANFDPKKYKYWRATFVSFVLCNGKIVRQIRWARTLGSNGAATIGPDYSVDKKNVMPDPKDVKKLQCVSNGEEHKEWAPCSAMGQNPAPCGNP